MIQSIGFYGKLPAFGDFISRNVPPIFVEQWDNWLLQSLETASYQLNENWQRLYLSAPIWRFFISSGVVSEHAYLGLTMPSVDKVGRLYPFTLVVALNQINNPFTLMTSLHPSMTKIEDFLIALLDEDTIDLEDVLTQLNKEITRAAPCLFPPLCQSAELAESEVFRCEMSSLNELGSAVLAMTVNLVKHQFEDYSLWWSTGSLSRPPQFRLFENLPAPQAFATFLDNKSAC